jgi:hypothetical protein
MLNESMLARGEAMRPLRAVQPIVTPEAVVVQLSERTHI